MQVTITINDGDTFSDAVRQLRRKVSIAMTDAQAEETQGMFANRWQVGRQFEQGEIVLYEGNLFRVNQTHTSQDDWLPTDTPALFTKLGTEDEVASGAPPWRQPTGGHDAYARGDRVTHNGYVWESTHDNNVWAPGVFGWKKV